MRIGMKVACAVLAVTAAVVRPSGQSAPEQMVRVDLAYRAPVAGQPSPNFSPKGTQVPLTDVAADFALPTGATRPARLGTIKVGPDQQSWIPVLATADADDPDPNRLAASVY